MWRVHVHAACACWHAASSIGDRPALSTSAVARAGGVHSGRSAYACRHVHACITGGRPALPTSAVVSAALPCTPYPALEVLYPAPAVPQCVTISRGGNGRVEERYGGAWREGERPQDWASGSGRQ